MWYGHIRDLSPTAEGCMGGRTPNLTWGALGTTTVAVSFLCALVYGSDGMVMVGWLGRACTALHCTHYAHTHAQETPQCLSFPSLPGRVVGEMPSAARYAVVGVVGRPFTHVVRDALCEGDEGIADVREQHRYPPSASAVRECSGNVVGVHAISLEIIQIVTSTIRAIYIPCVHC